MGNKVICHYGEIGLKGKNRKTFEDRLIKNIKTTLKEGFLDVKRISGRILVTLAEDSNEEKIRNGLSHVFGLTSFSFALSCSFDDIEEEIVSLLEKEEFITFKIDCKRSNKEFLLTSQQVNEKLGGIVIDKFNKKVKLKDPDLTLYVEIVEKSCYLFIEKIKGLGGLPVSVSGRAVSLISGGIDSPVSSFLSQKRGIELIYCHFHSLPFVDKFSVDKVVDLVKILNQYQNGSKIYLVPFADIQKEILIKTKEKFRVVLYRRMMLKIAERIALEEKAGALITGENLAQVASQTLPNISVIQNAVSIPVLRPLIMYDKEEIIVKAKEIGTFELSIREHQDCCSRFLPKHPSTNAKLEEVQKEEENLDIEKLVEKAIKDTKIKKI